MYLDVKISHRFFLLSPFHVRVHHLAYDWSGADDPEPRPSGVHPEEGGVEGKTA